MVTWIFQNYFAIQQNYAFLIQSAAMFTMIVNNEIFNFI